MRRRRSSLAVIVVLCSTVVVSHTCVGQQCVGDCNSDGRVTVNELITGINVELGSAPISACPSIDCGNLFSCIPGSLLIQAIRNALYGCPAPTSSDAAELEP